MKRKRQEPILRSLMKQICLLLAVILGVLLGGTALIWQMSDKVHYTRPTADFGTRLTGYLTELTSDDRAQRIGGTGSGIINILLVGQDGREGDAHARADSVLLCTYHRKTGEITMTSFLRDLYLPIPGHHDNRLNAAYSFGGAALLKETLSRNFGLHIDGCVEVDFSQFSQVIDLLGGVELELREDEAQVINEEIGCSLTQGKQTLNGEEALAYARIRKLDANGDFSRTDRQRKVVSALLDRYREIRWKDLLPLIDQILPMISTDMNYGRLVLLAMEILPELSDTTVSDQCIPAPGTCTDEVIDGMAVLRADLEANCRILRDTLASQG